MKLLELTPAEVGFLAPPIAVPDGLAGRLDRALTDTLWARLRCPVRLERVDFPSLAVASVAPIWQIDPVLAALWLTRRLGGHYDAGQIPFVPVSLRATLDAVLAERWLDGPQAECPIALAWRLTADGAQATLGLHLPRGTGEMGRWARQTIGSRAP